MRKISILTIVVVAALLPRAARAAGNDPRVQQVTEIRTQYIWVIGGWGFEYCRILTDDIKYIPQIADIEALCSNETKELLSQKIINLYYLGKYHYEEIVNKELAPITVKTEYMPGRLIVHAVDTLEGYSVDKIEVYINLLPAVCNQATAAQVIPGGLICEYPIDRPAHVTGLAFSSFGDSSKLFELRIGNMIKTDFIFSDPENIRVVIGGNAYTKWTIFDEVPMGWGVVPGAVPGWLAGVPENDLYTDETLYYLAGQLLLEGAYSAQGCVNNGLVGEYASSCGLLAGFPEILRRQNAYNHEIHIAAAALGVPNTLIKRIIAVESQFYPTALGVAGETGLYQLTREGADTILRWEYSTYGDLCGLYFDNCNDIPYDNLYAWQRDILANAILNDPNNIRYLAAALKGNAYQVKRLLYNSLRIARPGDYFSYVELWLITIGNYHTGPIITAAALDQLRHLEQSITWDNYAAALGRVSPNALDYINRVTFRDY